MSTWTTIKANLIICFILIFYMEIGEGVRNISTLNKQPKWIEQQNENDNIIPHVTFGSVTIAWKLHAVVVNQKWFNHNLLFHGAWLWMICSWKCFMITRDYWSIMIIGVCVPRTGTLCLHIIRSALARLVRPFCPPLIISGIASVWLGTIKLSEIHSNLTFIFDLR